MRAALAGGVLLLGLTGQAQAATTIGEATGLGSAGCSTDHTRVQDATASSGPSYAIPAGGGVITSWSHDVDSDTPNTATMRLKVFRKTGTQTYLTVGHSAFEPLTSAGLKVFATRISVFRAGDLLGVRTGGTGGTDCARFGQSGDILETSDTGDSDPPVDSTFNSAFTGGGLLLNIAAVVEPDADHDDFGDETQDQCPVDASTQGSCPDADADGVPDAIDQCPSQVGPASSNGCPDDDCAKAKKKLAKAKKKLKKLKQNDAGDEAIAKAKRKVKKAKKRKKEACA